MPPNWADLVKHSSELATNQDYNLAESWLVDSNLPSDLPPADNPVSNLYGIVPDHHNDISKGASSQNKCHQGISRSDSDASKTVVADSEGDHLSHRASVGMNRPIQPTPFLKSARKCMWLEG